MRGGGYVDVEGRGKAAAAAGALEAATEGGGGEFVEAGEEEEEDDEVEFVGMVPAAPGAPYEVRASWLVDLGSTMRC